jgi:hypothetical protein
MSSDGDHADLERRVAALEALLCERGGVRSEQPPEPFPRRELLRGVTAAAVGAIGGAAVASPSVAGAANGDALLLGVTGQTASSPTAVSWSGAQPFGFAGLTLSADDPLGQPTPLYPSLLYLQLGTNIRTGLSIDGGTWSGQVNDPGTYGVRARGAVGVEGEGGFVGVAGFSTSGMGVGGQATDGTGVAGFASSGTAVRGSSSTGAAAQLFSTKMSAANRAVHAAGDLDTDANHDLWWCTTASVPNAVGPDPTHWRKVAGPDTAGALHVRPSPTRIYDSRPNESPAIGPKTAMAAGSSRTIDADGNSGLPEGTTAVLLNIAVTDTTGTGYVGAFKGGDAWPGTVNVNWDHPNATVSNFAIVPVNANNEFTIFAGGSGTVDVIVDLLGYCR